MCFMTRAHIVLHWLSHFIWLYPITEPTSTSLCTLLCLPWLEPWRILSLGFDWYHWWYFQWYSWPYCHQHDQGQARGWIGRRYCYHDHQELDRRGGCGQYWRQYWACCHWWEQGSFFGTPGDFSFYVLYGFYEWYWDLGLNRWHLRRETSSKHTLCVLQPMLLYLVMLHIVSQWKYLLLSCTQEERHIGEEEKRIRRGSDDDEEVEWPPRNKI